jgi:hypothetical protein
MTGLAKGRNSYLQTRNHPAMGASATHFYRESLDYLRNSIDAAESDFAIPYSTLILVI